MYNVTLFSQLGRHSHLIGAVLVTVCSAFTLAITQGTAKPAIIISWLDITGEGSVVLLTFGWIVAVLASRPPGKVTALLTLGLTFFMFSALLDVLDEFLSYPASADWLSMVESIPAAIGMVIMSVALFWWHQEQLVLNTQLRRKEWDSRSHEQVDPITQLYRGDYWQACARNMLAQERAGCVVVLDINDFSQFNLRYGQQEGDRFLKEVAQLLVMHLRDCDLACRYAGDRFALLLPDMNRDEVSHLISQLCTSIRHLAFRCNSQTTAVFNSARAVQAQLVPGMEVSALLRHLNEQLDTSASQVA